MKALVPLAGVSSLPAETVAELRSRIANLKAGPYRVPGVPGSDDPGFVSAHVPHVEYHPDAERRAAELRTAREHSADHDTVAGWLEALSYAVAGNRPLIETVRGVFAGLVLRTCDFPLAVWQEALDEALLTFQFWPSVKELHELLARVDERQLAEIAGLDAIAKAPRERPGPAQEAPPRAPEPVPDWVYDQPRRQPLRERGDDDFDPDEARKLDAEARRSVIKQLAQLGDTADGTDLLTAVRKRLTPKQEGDQ